MDSLSSNALDETQVMESDVLGSEGIAINSLIKESNFNFFKFFS